MKKILLFPIIIFLSLSGCDDILEENPKEVATETFYSSADEIEAAIIPIYYQLQRGFRKNYVNIPDAQADWMIARGSYLILHQFQGYDNNNINRVSDIWIRIYRAIRDANLVVQNAPKAEDVTQEQLNAFIAEARFLRAYSYFQLVRNWGGVPLRTEENMVDLAVPRETAEEVYDFIIDDLEYGEIHLPDVPKMMGRPTKTAAKTMLVEIFLTLERWADSRQKALEVINSGLYSLVPVSEPDDFYNLYGPDVNGSSEEIFYLKYNREYGSNWPCMGHHPGSSYLNGRGYAGFYTDSVKNKVIREWDYKDLRKSFNFYSMGTAFGSPSTLFYKKFIDPETTSVKSSNDNPVYRYADLLLFYAEADCRANNGPTADGMEKLNMVHRRAYGYAPSSPSPVDFNAADYNEETFIDLVLKERGYETVYEGKRFFDLRRVGKVAEVIKDVHGIDINPDILLWPIPTHEFEYNDAIDESEQNPGY